MTHIYDSTAKGLMMLANSELEHVGRIISMKDKDLQYSYALSTVNGMAHLKDALFQYVEKHPESHMREDLLTIHDKIIRVMKHLDQRTFKTGTCDPLCGSLLLVFLRFRWPRPVEPLKLAYQRYTSFKCLRV
jgi:hypothetical protein